MLLKINSSKLEIRFQNTYRRFLNRELLEHQVADGSQNIRVEVELHAWRVGCLLSLLLRWLAILTCLIVSSNTSCRTLRLARRRVDLAVLSSRISALCLRSPR